MKVADLMSSEIITIAPHDDLGVALALMTEFDVRRLPVLDAEGGHLVGILSDRDVRLAIDSPFLSKDNERAAASLESILVGELMTTHLIVIGPNATVGEAARRMLSHRVSGLPVVQLDEVGNATLVGLISASDLLRYLADLEGERPAEG